MNGLKTGLMEPNCDDAMDFAFVNDPSRNPKNSLTGTELADSCDVPLRCLSPSRYGSGVRAWVSRIP